MVLASLVLVRLLAANPTGILYVHSKEIEESHQALLIPANWPSLEEKCKELNCSLTMEGNVAVVWPKGLYGLDEAPKFRQGLKKLLDEIDPTKVVDMQAISSESKEFVKSFLKRSDYPQYRRSIPESFPFILESSVGVSLRVGNRALDSINTMSNSPRFDEAFFAFEPKMEPSPDGSKTSEVPPPWALRFTFEGQPFHRAKRLEVIQTVSTKLAKMVREAALEYDKLVQEASRKVFGDDSPQKGMAYGELPEGARRSLRGSILNRMAEFGFKSEQEVDAFLKEAVVDRATPRVYLTIGVKNSDGSRTGHGIEFVPPL